MAPNCSTMLTGRVRCWASPTSYRIFMLAALALLLTTALALTACDALSPAQPPDPPAPAIVPARPVSTPSPESTPAPVPTSRPAATPSPEPTPPPVIPARYVITEAAFVEVTGSGNDQSARFELAIANAGGEGGPAPLPVTMAINDGTPRIIHVIERPTAGAIHLISPLAEVGTGRQVATFSLAGEQRRVDFNVPAPDLALSLQPLSITEGGLLLIPVMVTNIGDLRSSSAAVAGAWTPVAHGEGGTEQTARAFGRLNPGESRVLEFKLRPPPGEHRASFIVRARDYDIDASNNKIETFFDTQLVPLDLVSTSAHQILSWPSPELDLVDVSLRIRNRGHAAVTAPVGLVRSAAVADPAQPAETLSGLPRCSDGLADGCWLELSQAQVPAGGEITVWARITLAAGAHQLIGFVGDFATETATELRWDGHFFQEFPVQVAPQPPFHIAADLGASVLGYWSDGTASVRVSGNLANYGAQAFTEQVPLALACQIAGVDVDGCGELPAITLADGFTQTPFETELRVPMGTQVEIGAAFGEWTRREIQITVPERILDVDRGTWDCYAQRGYWVYFDYYQRCSGMTWSNVHKWDQSEPIRIWASGDSNYRLWLQEAVEKYFPLLGLRWEYVATEAEADLRAWVGVPRSIADQTEFNCVDAGGCAYSHTNDGGVTHTGAFVVWHHEPSGESQRVAVFHELLHAIVPISHRPYPGGDLSVRISPATEALLALNAHPLVKPGMTMAQVRGLVVLSDELLDPRGPDSYELLQRAGKAFQDAGTNRFRIRRNTCDSNSRFDDWGILEADRGPNGEIRWDGGDSGSRWVHNEGTWDRTGGEWVKRDRDAYGAWWQTGRAYAVFNTLLFNGTLGSLTVGSSGNGRIVIATAPAWGSKYDGRLRMAELVLDANTLRLLEYRAELDYPRCMVAVEGADGEYGIELEPLQGF